MASRADLDNVLSEIIAKYIGTDRVSDHLFFQPPETVKLKYPCIIYNLSEMEHVFANNAPYASFNRYSVTVIDRNPDGRIKNEIFQLPLCSFSRFFTSDNLNHYVFELYY